MPEQCGTNVYDAGPALNQHRATIYNGRYDPPVPTSEKLPPRPPTIQETRDRGDPVSRQCLRQWPPRAHHRTHIPRKQVIDPKLLQCWPTVHDAGPTSKQNRIKISCYLGYIKQRAMKHNCSDAGPAPSTAREPAPEQHRRTIYNCPTAAQN